MRDEFVTTAGNEAMGYPVASYRRHATGINRRVPVLKPVIRVWDQSVRAHGNIVNLAVNPIFPGWHRSGSGKLIPMSGDLVLTDRCLSSSRNWIINWAEG